QTISETSGEGNTHIIDAHHYAMRLFGDSIASNVFMLGYAWQRGLIPVSADAIRQAIELNGAAVPMNQRAFACGRLAAGDIDALDALLGEDDAPAFNNPKTLDEIISHRHTHLVAYQDEAYASQYVSRIREIEKTERDVIPGNTRLTETVAKNYAKLLSYKDEYEVARLFTDGTFEAALKEQFEGDYTLEFHLAPPVFNARNEDTGHLEKRRFGPWMMRAFRILARFSHLRGTRWDLFGYSAERKAERQAIEDYENTLDLIAANLSPENHEVAVELASLPRKVRGFGHVKEKNAAEAKVLAKELISQLTSSGPTPMTSDPDTPSQAAA
ncbi:MAG: DUF6537 domain-containing protein, partial [Hyphomicrobiaceae bacterium]